MLFKKLLSAFLIFFFLFSNFSVVLAANVSVSGKAKVLNTGNSYLDFTNYNSNVVIDDQTGNFSGYAFLEDIGWVAFGTTDNVDGPVNVNLTTGAVTGSAKSLNTSADIDFTNYNSNVVVNLDTGSFSGFAFSEDVGWLDFSDTGVSTAAGLGDSDPPLPFNLINPGSLHYTNNDRPGYIWNKTTDADSEIAYYNVEIDNGDTGDLVFNQVPANAASSVHETDTYIANYTSTTISLYTKSSGVWSAEQNDGKLKEGKRNWKVKAVDSNGNERSESHDFFLDRTSPTLSNLYVNSSPVATNMATLDRTPTISAKLTDTLAGEPDANKTAAGPKSIGISLEKRVYGDIYDVVSISNVNITDSYWENNNEKITDNTQNLSNKYANITYNFPNELSNGVYRITLTGVDNASNTSSSTTFYLTITSSFSTVATPISIPTSPPLTTEPAPTSLPEPTEAPISIDEEEVIEIAPDIEDNIVQESTFQLFKYLSSIYWKIVGIGKIGVNYIAGLWNGYVDFANNFNDTLYAYLINGAKSTGQIGKGFLALLDRIEGFMQPIANSAVQFAYNQQIKIASVAQILFDKEPTIITTVTIKEVGADYAVIYWETNHYTTNNKVNYGQSLSYGEHIISQERSKEHEFRIEGLEENKTYFFEVMSQGKNYTYDAHYEFTTGEK